MRIQKNTVDCNLKKKLKKHTHTQENLWLLKEESPATKKKKSHFFFLFLLSRSKAQLALLDFVFK